MKQKQIEYLANKYILPTMENYSLHKRTLISTPIDHILKGFYFENSGFTANRFNVTAFIQPLFIPSEDINFMGGGRLGTLSGGAENWWTLDEENEKMIFEEIHYLIENEGLPFLTKFSSVRDYANYFRNMAVPPNIYFLESVAYANILCKKYRKAQKLLRMSISTVQEAMKREHAGHWLPEMLARQETIYSQINNKNTEEAIKQLLDWEINTIKALGLETLILPPEEIS